MSMLATRRRFQPAPVVLPTRVPPIGPPPGNSPRQVECYARMVMFLFGLGSWSFGFDRAKRRLGACHHSKHLITLSRYYVALGNLEDIRDTVLHEVAHALCGPGHGHGHGWQMMASRVGAKPVRCGKDVEMPVGKWQATCGGCSKAFARHQRPKRLDGWSCRACGRERGKLTWTRVS